MNWLNDLKVGCKSPSYLVELIVKGLDIKIYAIIESKGSLEWDEIVNI
jgi:hypothetical protein